MKSKTTALILSVLCGGLGIDRFYLGYIGIGVLKLLTGGCFGILWIIDIICIATGSLCPADGSDYCDTHHVRTSSGACDELEKLAMLHAQGVLSDEEFAILKANCLSRM